MRLSDQVAIITGASGGLGGQIAVALAREGAAVIAHYSRNAEAAQEVVRAVEAGGGRAHAVAGDIANPDEAAAVVGAATPVFGRLDILVNNAAIARDGLGLRMRDEDWQTVVATNLNGTFYCIRAALREFIRQRRGRIINIASTAGQAGNVGQANYVVAKAGILR